MYPKFIELHHIFDGSPVSVNVAEITKFSIDEDCETFVDMTNGYTLVKESYDDIKALISDCGCLIHKADPRLDMTHPLTLNDLKDMVGEPVWNSNINVWMLVKDVTDTWAKMLWTSGNISEYTEDELIKYPVYRMRRA